MNIGHIGNMSQVYFWDIWGEAFLEKIRRFTLRWLAPFPYNVRANHRVKNT
ncbi:hypothetical protein VCR14J2_620168 [Vibrio coralliirubri]|nr:hypothetical protein VCR14J2_620168 [Vibrio coralliirubri]